MKKLKLDASLSPLEESELDRTSGGWGGILSGYFGGILRFVKGALDNPPNLPSAGDYK